jgi:hypothetical protein
MLTFIHNGFLFLALTCFLIDGFKFEITKIKMELYGARLCLRG